MKKLLLLVAALAMSVVPFSMTEGSEALELRRIITSYPASLDPQKQSLDTERLILTDIFSGLTYINAEGSVQPDIAAHWTISADGTRYDFYLREDARWQDGQPVTAHDFVLGFTRMFALMDESQLSHVYKVIAGSDNLDSLNLPIDLTKLSTRELGVSAIDDHHLAVQLKRPFRHFLYVLSLPPAFPTPLHIYQKHGEKWLEPEHFLGNGAYRLVEHVQDVSLTATKNQIFHDKDDVSIPRVRYINIPDDMTPARMITKTRAHIAAIPHYQQNALETLNGFDLHSMSSSWLITLQFNPQHRSLADKRVRKALYMSVNRDRLVTTIGRGHLATHLLVPPMPGYKTIVPPLPPLPEAIRVAQSLMQEAGYNDDNRLHVKLQIPDSYTGNVVYAQLKRDWARIYTDVEMVPTPFSNLMENTYSGEFQIIIRSWVADYPDPIDFLNLYTNNAHPTLYPEPDPIYASLIAKAQKHAANPGEQTAQAELHMMEKYLAVPLYAPRLVQAVSTSVQGWSNVPSAINPTRQLQIIISP